MAFGLPTMNDLFGLGFFEWWAGLRRTVRVLVGVALLVVGLTLAYLAAASGFVWVPLVITGGLLVLLG